MYSLIGIMGVGLSPEMKEKIMRISSRMGLCVLSAIVLVAVVGCPDSRTSNQGGGSIITVGAKLASNPSDPPIGDLNPDELQVLADNMESLASMAGITLPEGATIPSLTDEEAAEIEAFLDANGVNNISDLESLAAAIEAGTIDVPESLMSLAAAFGMPMS